MAGELQCTSTSSSVVSTSQVVIDNLTNQGRVSMMREGDTFGDSWRRVGEHMSTSLRHYRHCAYSFTWSLQIWALALLGLYWPRPLRAPSWGGAWRVRGGTWNVHETDHKFCCGHGPWSGPDPTRMAPSPEGACAKDVLKSSPVRPLKGFPHWESDHTKLPNSTSPLMPTPPQWLVLFLLTSSLETEWYTLVTKGQ